MILFSLKYNAIMRIKASQLKLVLQSERKGEESVLWSGFTQLGEELSSVIEDEQLHPPGGSDALR